MKLNETVKMMNSADYKERFKAEYLQLKIRMNGLSAMLKKYEAGTLNFTPSCPIEVLRGQLINMGAYKNSLIERAEIEDIDLEVIK